VVRGFQLGVLRDVALHTVPALLQRLRADAPPASLALWISLAESLGDSRCLAAVVALQQHPVAQIRISTARALGRYFHADGRAALRRLIADIDWRVRAQAARALGVFGAVDAVPELSRALGDPSWWVRFRAALALVQLGDAGRRALQDATRLPDRYAAEMAVMVSGLPAGGVAELGEA
jgi:HEAT repeat protein